MGRLGGGGGESSLVGGDSAKRDRGRKRDEEVGIEGNQILIFTYFSQEKKWETAILFFDANFSLLPKSSAEMDLGREIDKVNRLEPCLQVFICICMPVSLSALAFYEEYFSTSFGRNTFSHRFLTLCLE